MTAFSLIIRSRALQDKEIMSGPERLVGKGQIKSSQVIQACDSSMVNHFNKRVKGPTNYAKLLGKYI